MKEEEEQEDTAAAVIVEVLEEVFQELEELVD